MVKLRKNFGQSAALRAGLDYATGKTVITMDADLQNDPRDIPKFLEKLKKKKILMSSVDGDLTERTLSQKKVIFKVRKSVKKEIYRRNYS